MRFVKFGFFRLIKKVKRRYKNRNCPATMPQRTMHFYGKTKEKPFRYRQRAFLKIGV